MTRRYVLVVQKALIVDRKRRHLLPACVKNEPRRALESAKGECILSLDGVAETRGVVRGADVGSAAVRAMWNRPSTCVTSCRRGGSVRISCDAVALDGDATARQRQRARI